MAGFRSGLFWGAFFGAVAGLMNAPQSGKDTREDIKYFLEVTTDDVNDVRYKIDNLKVALQRLSKESIDSGKVVSDDIQTTLKHFEEENEPRIKRVIKKSETLQENLDRFSN